MLSPYDIAYGLALGLAAPYWLARPAARRKVLRALRERMGQAEPRNPAHAAIMIHAVSLGEMNATRGLVERLGARRPDLRFIISTTTDTGYARGLELYGKNPRVILARYPLDFTRGVARFLDNLRPDVVALMELELWPNFIKHCRQRGIPVVLINGRLTSYSFRNYRLAIPLMRRMLGRLSAICAQDELYASRFAALGAPADRLKVTGTMKFDTATVADRVEGDRELAAQAGLRPGQESIWVCGSTGPGEEQIVLRCYRDLLAKHPRLRLAIIPRKPERFDEVGGLIRSAGFDLVRRSQTRSGEPMPPAHGPSLIGPVVLGDTMGELRKFYSLADVVFVGRSLVDLGSRQHGSDMIEPAALAKPVIVGPYTANFAEAVARFREARAIVVAKNEAQLTQAVTDLLHTSTEAAAMGRRAQNVVRDNQGATDWHVEVILQELGHHPEEAWPAVVRAEA